MFAYNTPPNGKPTSSILESGAAAGAQASIPTPARPTPLAPTPAEAEPVFFPGMTPQAAEPVYAHPPGAQIPIPSREELGLEPAPKVDYNTTMERLYGPLPPPQQFTQDWRTPESRAAVKAFQSALLANFTSSAAAGGNAISLFFQSNPYAYMLGQSFDMVEDQLQGISAKNGGTDRIAAQYMTVDNLMDSIALVHGLRQERLTGKWPGDPNRRQYLTTEFKKKLDAMHPRARVSLLNSGNAFTENDPNIANALSNMNNAQANMIQAETQRRNQNLKETEFEKVTIPKTKSEIAESGARVKLNLAQSEDIKQRLPFIAMSENAKINLAAAQARSLDEQNQQGLIRLTVEGASAQERTNMSYLTAAQYAEDAAYKQLYLGQQKLAEMRSDGLTETPAYKEALAKVAALEKIYDQKLEIVRTFSEQFKAKSESLSAQTYGLSTWLPVAANNQNYDYPSVYKYINNNNNNEFIRPIFFPNTPKKWDASTLSFITDDSIGKEDFLSPAAVAFWHDQVAKNLELLNDVRKGKIMSFSEWQKANPENTNGYRHYVSIMNQIRQTDYLLRQYQKAVNSNMTVQQYAANRSMSVGVIQPDFSQPTTQNKKKGGN